MTVNELKEKQAAMSYEALIGFAKDQVSELARTGGKSHQMTVPPQITDTDMLFSELIKRFEHSESENLEMKKQNTELAELLKKSVRIVKQMDDHTKKCIDNI